MKANLGYLVIDQHGNEFNTVDNFDELVYFVSLVKEELENVSIPD